MQFTLTRATPDDAGFIAEAIMGALGPELCVELAGAPDNLPAVRQLFTALAACDDSQYSYRNTLIAKNSEGKDIGALVFYDGALLRSLRKAFVTAANQILGWGITEADFEKWGDETGPDQIYLDSLYVTPENRGHGVATALINAAVTQSKSSGKPCGLLVEKENIDARRLYVSLGFRPVGISNFFSTPMLHLQKP